MKRFLMTTFIAIVTLAMGVGQASALSYSYNPYSNYNYSSTFYNGNNYSYPYENNYYPNYYDPYASQRQELLMRSQTANYYNYTTPYYYDTPTYYNNPYQTVVYGSGDDRPDAQTNSARDIDDDSAELRGEIDMNDFDDGIVFFVYGQDEDKIDDVESDYDSYRDVNDDEEDDDFEVERVQSNFDGDDDFDEKVNSLDDNTDYYFRICVEYEDDGDEELECGNVRDFETDN